MYKIINETIVQRLTDGAFIHAIGDMQDSRDYQEWLAEGNTPEPYVPPPPPIPATVTRFQALAVLAAGGYLDTVRTYIATLGEDNITRLAWENAADWERTSPTLNALATMLNLTSAEVDDLFVAASQVSA